jgi:hypothetical protein
VAEQGSLNQIIEDASCGKAQALYFLSSMYHAIDLWDDLIDRDEEISDERVHATFEFLLVHLPGNQWFLTHVGQLQPVMQAFIISWHTGNEQKARHPEQTYILRQLYFDLITVVAVICGGYDHGKAINRRLWATSADFLTLQQYKDKNGLLGS